MTFVQVEFLLLFAVTWVGCWLAPSVRSRNTLLLVASAAFYGWAEPRFLLLLYGSALLDYAMGLALVRYPAQRTAWLAISLTGNLGVLALFKYADFFLSSFADAASRLGWPVSATTLGWVLPAGISFYTFQTLSYTLDVSRGALQPRRDLIDYLTFVSFFSQLVAGPIERASRLLPQLERMARFSPSAIRTGLSLMVFGAFKKLVIADTLAPYVDRLFLLAEPAPVLLWAGALAFGLQLYADFSGYTDLARGSARLLGIELSENFREPWLARDTPDFWRRWHISLSTWIRDYLLAPLLGAAPGTARVTAALLLTFLLVGLWHGAGWNFIAFGLWHGLWVLIFLGLLRVGWAQVPSWIAVPFHTLVVQLPGSLLFRDPEPGRLPGLLARAPWAGSVLERGVAVEVIGLTLVLTLPLLAEWGWRRAGLGERLGPAAWLVRGPAWGLAVLGMVVFYRETSVDFLYFRF